MTYNPDIHNRKSIRLKNYDYSREGLYFITICSHNKECIFGEIIEEDVGVHCMCPNDIVKLNEYGKIVENELLKTKEIRKNIQINQYVIMPNHIHFVIEIISDNKGHMQCAPTNERSIKNQMIVRMLFITSQDFRIEEQYER